MNICIYYIMIYYYDVLLIYNIYDDLPIPRWITGSPDHRCLVAEDRLAFAYGSNWEAVTAVTAVTIAAIHGGQDFPQVVRSTARFR